MQTFWTLLTVGRFSKSSQILSNIVVSTEEERTVVRLTIPTISKVCFYGVHFLGPLGVQVVAARTSRFHRKRAQERSVQYYWSPWVSSESPITLVSFS